VEGEIKNNKTSKDAMRMREKEKGGSRVICRIGALTSVRERA
jgi:hypothetical protein